MNYEEKFRESIEKKYGKTYFEILGIDDNSTKEQIQSSLQYLNEILFKEDISNSDKIRFWNSISRWAEKLPAMHKKTPYTINPNTRDLLCEQLGIDIGSHDEEIYAAISYIGSKGGKYLPIYNNLIRNNFITVNMDYRKKRTPAK